MTDQPTLPAASSSATVAVPREVFALSAVAAGARFVPVPFLDDIVKDRANRTALSQTIKAAQHDVSVQHLKPLYDTGSIIGFLLGIPWKLLLFPVRKVVRILGAVRGVPTDALETYLLARMLSRHLAAGGFASREGKALTAEAKRVRQAFDAAFKGTNWRVLTAALSGLRGKKAEAEQVEAALARRDVQAELQAFDARFDEAMAA